ncbi:PP2C family protein-serine/threonine phosphatase [Virgibacillus ndiopensis]|uniref:PP2C family protein-serine/threonine phosphatase n=1 Tax=Virgibacillus ndiopensis TaxID=2004408 RepID=UPI001145B507|nr:protein phosphatase 2C domain-containing protein [Virgibacillus ndiopensis]
MNANWQMGIGTHQGTKKDKNEDSYLYRISKDNKGNEIALFVVADGMGGYQVGDAASRLATLAFQKWWEKRISKLVRKKDVIQRVIDEGEKVLRQINKSIIATSNHNGEKMGTTVSLLILYKGDYAVIHIGDSRVYQMKGWNYGLQQYFHNQKLTTELMCLIDQQNTEVLESEPELIKLTEDHSWVDKQVKEGKMTEEQARNHPKRNVLTQCLGINNEITPCIKTGKFQSSDLFLVCSDGFHSLFSNDEIKNMLISLEKEYTNLQAICDYLINFSNFREAYDNITLLLVRNLYANQVNSEKRGLLSFF